jgi:nitroreductase
MSQLPKAEDFRKADYPIEPLFVRRWSPRAMSGEPITEREMLTLFEAARWAPSTYNEQEWRFLYARRDTPQWPPFSPY